LHRPVVLIGASDLDPVVKIGCYGQRRNFIERKVERIKASARVRCLLRTSHPRVRAGRQRTGPIGATKVKGPIVKDRYQSAPSCARIGFLAGASNHAAQQCAEDKGEDNAMRMNHRSQRQLCFIASPHIASIELRRLYALWRISTWKSGLQERSGRIIADPEEGVSQITLFSIRFCVTQQWQGGRSQFRNSIGGSMGKE